MTTKLTLTVDPKVVAAAKQYAARTGTSVSQLVEAYLAAVVAPSVAAEAPPVLARLRGCLAGAEIGDYRRYQLEKYR